MKTLKHLLLLLCFFTSSTLSFSVLAHGDHDHGPSAKSSPKGGRMLETEGLHIELVNKAHEIIIYVYDNEMKPLKDLTILSAKFTSQLPRKEKLPLDLKIMNDHFHGKFDKGPAHRFDLEMTLSFGGHTDKLKWTVE